MTKTPAADRLLDGRFLRAHLVNGHLPRLIATFDFRTPHRQGFTPVRASREFAKRGWAQLHVTSRRNDWFISPDTVLLEHCLADISRQFAYIHALGFLMGGYGALRFAAAMQARRVVIVSPQFSIHPDVTPNDTRFHQHAGGFDRALGDLTPHANAGLNGVMVVDPFLAADWRHARCITALFPALRAVRLGFGGHPAATLLRGAGHAGLIRRAALDPDADLGEVNRADCAAKRQNPEYWQRLGAFSGAQHPHLADWATTQHGRLTLSQGSATRGA